MRITYFYFPFTFQWFLLLCVPQHICRRRIPLLGALVTQPTHLLHHFTGGKCLNPIVNTIFWEQISSSLVYKTFNESWCMLSMDLGCTTRLSVFRSSTLNENISQNICICVNFSKTKDTDLQNVPKSLFCVLFFYH